MPFEHIEVMPEVIVPNHRLGRNIDHRARALAMPFAGPRMAVKSVNWPRSGGGILDQGNVGSCTGNASVGALETLPVFPALPVGHPALNETEALKIYSAGETIDGDGPYPPNDNGSTGPSVAQACVNFGFISAFNHYVTLDDTLQALMLGPVIVGIAWFTSFDTPSSSGLVDIAPGATVRGGHEVLMRVVDVANSMLGLDNSWGTSFGVNGSFSMSFDTFSTLLSQQGDTTAFTPLAVKPTTKVPGLNGHSAGFAHNALVAAGLVPVAAAGQKATARVFGTMPKAGSMVAKGSKVTILAR